MKDRNHNLKLVQKPDGTIIGADYDYNSRWLVPPSQGILCIKLGGARYCPPLNATLLPLYEVSVTSEVPCHHRMSTVSVAFLLRMLAVELARAGNKVMVKILGVKRLELNVCETIHEVRHSADHEYLSRLG